MTLRVFAPGRVNTMGDHIDYLGGLVLPLALPQGTTVELSPIEGGQHEAFSSSHGEARWPIGTPPAASGQWFDYLAGALAPLDRAVSVTVDSNLPQGSGLSSSASLLVALITARNALQGRQASPLEVAIEARQVEVEHIGLNCGIMDQYASALGEAGHALRLDCEHLRHESVRFELGSAELWAVDSKAPRKLAGGVYNQRVAECAEIERRAGSNDWFAMTPDLPAPLDARLRHIQSEQARVIETCQVAEQGDWVRWGALMNESHRSLSQDYEVAGDAMDRLQAALSGSRGCYGARMTGGGFGGCVIALIERESVPSVQQQVAEAYGDTQWIPCTPSAGVRIL